MKIEEAEAAVAKEFNWEVEATHYRRLAGRDPDQCLCCGITICQGEALFSGAGAALCASGAVCGDRQGCRKRRGDATVKETARQAAELQQREAQFANDLVTGKVTL